MVAVRKSQLSTFSQVTFRLGAVTESLQAGGGAVRASPFDRRNARGEERI
jgi:hypothetical protein